MPKLNQALERVMGWEGYHLHMLDVGGILFGEPDEDADYVINEKAATVKHVLPRVGASLRWDYDFGDGWEHDVVVEAIESFLEGKRYPVCLDGERACPPEDCGGIPGYERLLAALADPKRIPSTTSWSSGRPTDSIRRCSTSSQRTEGSTTMSRLIQPSRR